MGDQFFLCLIIKYLSSDQMNRMEEQDQTVLQEDQFHQKQRDRQICLQPQVKEDMLRQKQQNRLYSC